MTTYSHTPVVTGAAANAATINSPIGQLDGAIGSLAALTTTDKASTVAAVNEVRAQTIAHGANVTDYTLIAWAEAGAYQMATVTYSGTYTQTVSSATVTWPDGSTGVFTATTINATFESVDAYTITHVLSSKTVTQTAITRNADGLVTNKPVLTVS